MLTVACVLRSGGIYTPEWANRLQRGVARHLPIPHEFVCLTDTTNGLSPEIRPIPLEHDWPGWLSKQELFRPGQFDGLVIYIDLDSVVVGDLSSLASYEGPRAILWDFYDETRHARGLRHGKRMIGSGVMLWMGDEMRAVWDAFIADPKANMAAHPLRSDHFTDKHMGRAHWIQDLWPGQVVSFKVHARLAVPPNARIVCLHGRPRLNTLAPQHPLRREWEKAA